MVAMVPSELAFLEARKEFIFSDAVKFKEAMFSEAPKGFDAVDMVLTPDKFVFVVMDTMMTKTAGHQAIVSFPTVSVNVAWGEDIASENGHQLLLGELSTTLTNTRSPRL